MKEETIYFNTLKNNKDKVEYILKNNKRARDNDNYLVALFWYYENPKIMDNTITMHEFLRSFKNNMIVSPDIITRSRRKLQEFDPELRGENYNKRHKSAKYIKNNIKKL
jgi:hypothetical protein